jgi:hypothetical protein
MRLIWKILTGAASVAAIIAGSPASASILYSNGALNGTQGAYQVSGGQQISDSFTLTQASVVTGVEFGDWTVAGATTTSIDWAITSDKFAYPIDATAGTTNTFVGQHLGLYDINLTSFSTGPLSLGAGTYYLVLQNAVTSDGQFAAWDINSGPSQVTLAQGGITQGPLPDSEFFQILGVAVPEPASWALTILGFGAVGAALRRRREPAGVVRSCSPRWVRAGNSPFAEPATWRTGRASFWS